MKRLLQTSIALLLAVQLVAPTLAAETANLLKPFVSDGCSRFPDGTPEHPGLWRDCCVAHDLAYWRGGTFAERAAADTELRRCVEQRAGRLLADVMFSGVRIGGSPYWPTTFRWGFGWNYPRAYGELNKTETQAVAERLRQINDEVPSDALETAKP